MTISGNSTGPFSSLRIRNFRFLLVNTVLSNAAQWIQQVTLGWIVYDLTGSGTMLGSINLVRSIAAFGMIPVAGTLTDRFKRRDLMMLTKIWLFVMSFGLGLLLLFDRAHILHLFIFAFLAGMAQTLDITLRQVVVFDLVPRSIAPNAVAMVQTGWSLMRSFGPSVGGFLLIWFGAGGNFLCQAGVYVIVTIFVMFIHFPERKSEVVKSSPFKNISEGLRYVTGKSTTRTFMLMGFVLPLLIIPIFSILPPIYAVDVFHGGPEILGFLLSSVGLGGIGGGIVIMFMSRVERRGLVQLACLALCGLSIIAFAYSTELSMALPVLVVSGFFEMIFLTTNQTLLQLSIPDELRGRVTSIVNLNAILSPLGGLFAGVGSDLLGGPKTITIIMSMIAIGVAVFILLASPTIRNYRLSSAISSNPSQ